MTPFESAVYRAVEDNRETENAGSRAMVLVVTSLAIMDGFKLENTMKGEAVTEAEWLEFCKRAYWKARAAIQGGAA
jgi:hypothetical protein